MKVTFNPTVGTINRVNAPQNMQSSSIQNNTIMASNQVAFNGWFDDATYYFAKKLDDRKEAKKQAQFQQVREKIYDDVRFIAERQGISLQAAKQRYEDNIDLVAIPLKHNGYEQGLNMVVGYSLEKYKAMMEVVLPLMVAQKGTSKEYPVPNGVLLYGPGHTGKTHFALALGEHIELKGAAEFREIKTSNTDIATDDPVKLLTEIEEAEERFKKTGKRQVLFFDNLNDILGEETTNLSDVFLGKVGNCAQNGITWIGTVNSPEDLPEFLFKPSRLNSDIFINKMSEGEKSAVMSYFWTKYDRQDDSSHDTILNENKFSGFRFYPPEVNDVSRAVDEDLSSTKDRRSYLNSGILIKRPVTTKAVNTHIDKYLRGRGHDRQESDDVSTARAELYRDFVKEKRGKYADKK